jgi:RNase P/RNase MRP subunit POP5
MGRTVLLIALVSANLNAQTFADLERQWIAAYHRRYVGIDGRGVVSTRQDELDEAKAPPHDAPEPPMTILDERISEVKSRTYGKTVIVTALNTATIRTKAGESIIRCRRSTVWVRKDGRWQCVHFHASKVMP